MSDRIWGAVRGLPLWLDGVYVRRVAEERGIPLEEARRIVREENDEEVPTEIQ